MCTEVILLRFQIKSPSLESNVSSVCKDYSYGFQIDSLIYSFHLPRSSCKQMNGMEFWSRNVADRELAMHVPCTKFYRNVGERNNENEPCNIFHRGIQK